uniref:Uncharacterized protein n=1 Tax=Arundo donax TaxID=35708 RepID=A0A0A8YBB4_ARUDO
MVFNLVAQIESILVSCSRAIAS